RSGEEEPGYCNRRWNINPDLELPLVISREPVSANGTSYHINNRHTIRTGSCVPARLPLVAEALAMKAAMGQALDLHFEEVICRSDSAKLIKALKEEDETPKEIYGTVQDIKALSISFHAIDFEFT
ncbi:unnamed protein product, partial [Thlaspi arvense]